MCVILGDIDEPIKHVEPRRPGMSSFLPPPRPLRAQIGAQDLPTASALPTARVGTSLAA